MIEKQTINGKDIWLKIDQYLVQPDVLPAEYFTASYYFQEPSEEQFDGELIKDDDGSPKKFESPVQALTFAWKMIGEKK